jgi:hypothetical protein
MSKVLRTFKVVLIKPSRCDDDGYVVRSAELGELLPRASIGECDEARAEFNRTVKIAAQQGAVSFERKARDSLRRHFS